MDLEFLRVHFPVSGVDTWIFLPPLVAFVVSTLTSMGGVSGAFLLLPFQVSFLHFTSPSVSATNFVFNIVAIPSGVYRYLREGRMAWPLTWLVIVGTLPGVFIGYYLRVRYLPNPVTFKLFVGCVLLYIGTRLLYEMTARSLEGKKQMKVLEDMFNQHARQLRESQAARVSAGLPPEAVVKTVAWSLSRVEYEFWGQRCYDGEGFLPQDRWHVWAFDVGTGKGTQLTKGKHDELCPAGSPDGEWVAYVTNVRPDPDHDPMRQDLFVVSIRGGNPRRVPTPEGPVDLPSFSPDGTKIAYYGHTDPLVSSTALSTLIAEFYASARYNSDQSDFRRLYLQQVNDPKVQQGERNIEELIRHYSSRTTEFKEYIAQGPAYLEFVALEENDLIYINQGKSTPRRPSPRGSSTSIPRRSGPATPTRATAARCRP